MWRNADGGGETESESELEENGRNGKLAERQKQPSMGQNRLVHSPLHEGETGESTKEEKGPRRKAK